MCRKATDCVLILCPTTLLQVFISCRSFLVLLMYKIISPNEDARNSVNKCTWLVWIIGLLYSGLYNKHSKSMKVAEPIYLEEFILVLTLLHCVKGVYVKR